MFKYYFIDFQDDFLDNYIYIYINKTTKIYLMEIQFY